MATNLVDRAWMSVSGTPGTGDITLGTVVAGNQSFTDAGVVDGIPFGYVATDGNDFEIGEGQSASSVTVWKRTTVSRSSVGGSVGTSKLTLSSSAQIFITARASDLADCVSPSCGRLLWVSTTSLKFLPFKGNTIKINGRIRQIPSAGIAGLGSPTSVYLNGTAAQTLAINTTYYVYAFDNSGTITADFSTTGHSASATAGNVGTEIKTGDDTRSLIGMVRTGATVIYASDMQTASWFNRRSKTVSISTSLSAAGNTASIPFVTWSDESVSSGMAGYLQSSAISNVTIQPRYDGINTSPSVTTTIPATNYVGAFNTAFSANLSEGNHVYDASLSGTAGTVSASANGFVQMRG